MIFKRNLIMLLFIFSLISCMEAMTFAKQIISDRASLYSDTTHLADSNATSVTVNMIHGLDLNDSVTQSLLAGQTVIFPKILTNVGNVTDNVAVKLSEPLDDRWEISLIFDDNQDGVYQEDENNPVPATLKIAPTSQQFFFVKMKAPDVNAGDVSVELTASSSFTSKGNYRGNNNTLYSGFSNINSLHTALIVYGKGPAIADVKFDEVLVVDGDYIGTSPLITGKIMDQDGVAPNSIKISIDKQEVNSNDIIVKKVSTTNYTFSYQINKNLSAGMHTIVITVKDSLGNSGMQTFFVQVTAKPKLIGKVLPYPNPFNPDKGDVKITYRLTGDTDVIIYIYTITGERIWTVSCDSGSAGGCTGYNEVVWDGNTGFHSRVPNGVYLVQVMNTKGKLMGKTKILVIR